MDLDDKGKQTCLKDKSSMPKTPSESAGWKKFLRARYLLPAVIVLAVIISLTVIFLPPALNARQLALGEQYLQDGNHELALAAFDKVLRRDKDRMEARLGKAKSLMGINPVKAEAYILELMEAVPEVPEVYLLLARVKILQGDIACALDVISQGEKSVGDSAFAELKREIDTKIAIRSSVQEAKAGESISIHLVYDYKKIVPQWSVDTQAALVEANADGNITIRLPFAGEVKVTAVFGPITRETVFVFSAEPRESTPEEDLLQEVPIGELPKPVNVTETGFKTGMKGWVLDSPLKPDFFYQPRAVAYNDILLFFTAPAITAVSVESGEILWVRKFPEGYESGSVNTRNPPKPGGKQLTYSVWHSASGDSYDEQINLDTGKIMWTGRISDGGNSHDLSYTVSGRILTKYGDAGQILWEATLDFDPDYCVLEKQGGPILLLRIPDSGLVALDKDNGEKLWNYEGNLIVGFLDEQIVVLGSSDRKEFVLADVVSGRVQAKYEYQPGQGYAFIRSEGMYYTDPAGLRRIDPSTGEELWKLQLQGRIAPALTRDYLNTFWCYGLVAEEQELYAINIETGKLIRTYCAAGVNENYHRDLRLDYAKDMQGRSYTCFSDYQREDPRLVIFDAETGQEVWNIPHKGSVYTCDSSNYLILISDTTGEVIYFNLLTGNEDFKEKALGTPILRSGDSMLFEASGKILFLSRP